jgi:hypothetical protein
MLKPFKILKSENEANVEGIDYTILINTDHITSMKKINILQGGNIIAGYWVRLLNGKKYKATRIPNELQTLFKNENEMALMNINGEDVASGEALH